MTAGEQATCGARIVIGSDDPTTFVGSGCAASEPLRACYLREQVGVFEFPIAGEQQHFADYLCRFWIVISEGKEQAPAVLGMHGDDEQGPARLAVRDCAAQMDRVFGAVSFDKGVVVLQAHIGNPQQGHCFAEERGTHLHGRGGGFRIDPAAVG